jgi:hypothetical protein
MFICPAVERNHFFHTNTLKTVCEGKKDCHRLSFFVCQWFAESNHNPLLIVNSNSKYVVHTLDWKGLLSSSQLRRRPSWDDGREILAATHGQKGLWPWHRKNSSPWFSFRTWVLLDLYLVSIAATDGSTSPYTSCNNHHFFSFHSQYWRKWSASIGGQHIRYPTSPRSATQTYSECWGCGSYGPDV